MVRELTVGVGLLFCFASVGAADFNLRERAHFGSCCDDSQCNGTCDVCESGIPGCDNQCDSQRGCKDQGCLALTCNRYWSFFGGWSNANSYFGEDTTFQRQGTFQDGYVLGGAMGRYLTCHLRHEFEFAYRSSQADQWSSVVLNQPTNFVPWNGNLNAFSGMSNLVYDFGNRDCQKITPYVGGGVGFAFVNADLNSFNSQFRFDDSAFAYQGFSGLSMKCRNNASLFAEYRFFGTDQVNLLNGFGATLGEYSYRSHNAIFGIQFRR